MSRVLSAAVLAVSIDTPHRCTEERLSLPECPRASRAMFGAQLARLLAVHDPFQFAGELSPLDV